MNTQNQNHKHGSKIKKLIAILINTLIEDIYSLKLSKKYHKLLSS